MFAFQQTWPEWLPLIAPYTPMLLWITRDLEAAAASYRRLGWKTPGDVSVEEIHELCGECYEAWPWGKLKFDIEQLAGVLGEFDAGRVNSA